MQRLIRVVQVPKKTQRLVFYVDTECSFSAKGKCTYYTRRQAQQQAAKGRRELWTSDCCPIVYVKTGSSKFRAFCPTRGGPFGEQVPATGGPSPDALRVEVQPHEGESWADIVEKAAKTACAVRCEETANVK